jgi:D-glucosaminate-6-phosphate ammonia-lyase
VDAASEHLERPSPWLLRGADMVIYSGGKFLRGPQTSGLLLGNKNLVQAAWRNASPHQAFGRPMKVSKEDVIGVLVAVEYWLNERDEAAELRHWHEDLQEIARRVATVPGTSSEVIEPAGVVRVPALRVKWGGIALDGMGLRQRLLDGSPRIMTDDTSATANSLAIDPFQFSPGEAAQVGQAIADALKAAHNLQPAAEPAAVLDLSGNWNVRVQFLHGERTHRLRLHQQGSRLSGSQQSEQFESDVTGRLAAQHVRMEFETRHEGSAIAYRFEGTASDGRMQGEVVLGSATDSHRGPVNLSQFGKGQWQAERH